MFAGHEAHVAEPDAFAYLSSPWFEHGMHALWPRRGLDAPTGHGAHAVRGVEESPASRYVPAAHGAHAPTTATPPIEREVASSRYSPPPHVVAHAPRAASWALPVGQVTRRARRGEGAESDAKDKSDAGGCASTGSADDDAPTAS